LISTMRIVVTGLVASFPLGGVAWDYLAYVDGFRRLGCDVLYLEDTGQWVYDPRRETYTEDASDNLRLLVDALRAVEAAPDSFAFRAPDGTFHGKSREEVTRFCRSADLFLNVSGACWLRDEYRGARRTAYLDSDPGYTQAKLLAYDRGLATKDEVFSVGLIREHDCFLTFAENVGQPDCAIPASGLDWIPTRQPVVLERWPFSFDARAERFTTVMSWKTDVSPPMIDGVRYGGKDVEFTRFLDLPRRAHRPIEIAMSGAAPVERLAASGWHLVSAKDRSATMDAYRAYLQAARGEWSVSKNVYVALRSGWFSCRSAVYLALGKPVVVQDTGWSKHYPTGNGLFAFSDLDGAVAGLDAVDADYRRQCEAARAVAEEAFAADKVLRRLLADCGVT
jgi:hypothetical protein